MIRIERLGLLLLTACTSSGAVFHGSDAVMNQDTPPLSDA